MRAAAAVSEGGVECLGGGGGGGQHSVTITRKCTRCRQPPDLHSALYYTQPWSTRPYSSRPPLSVAALPLLAASLCPGYQLRL